MTTKSLAYADTAERRSHLPPLMRMFALWTVLLCAVSVCYHSFFHFVLHQHRYVAYPFTQPSWYRFADFWIFKEKFTFFHTAHFFEVGFPINYPAPVAVVFEIFFKYFAPHPTAAFESFILLSLIIPAVLFARELTRRGIAARRAWPFIAIIWLLSWPVLLIVDGGNAEILVWIAMAVAMWAYATGRSWIAAVFFGFAASLKLFPFVFLALFLSRRQFSRLLAGAASFLITSVVSLAILGPTIPVAYRGILYGLTYFKHMYMAKWWTVENGVDHSLFASIKLGLYLFFHHVTWDYTGWLNGYLLVTSIGGTIAYFAYIRKLPLLNQVLILVIVSIYLTPFSGDGTLIHLYYPLAMLFLLAIQAWRDGVAIPGMKLILGCMVFCLSIDSFFVVPYKGIGARFIGEAHCVGLTIMLIATLYYRLGPPLAEQRGEIVLSQPVTGWVKA